MTLLQLKVFSNRNVMQRNAAIYGNFDRTSEIVRNREVVVLERCPYGEVRLCQNNNLRPKFVELQKILSIKTIVKIPMTLCFSDKLKHILKFLRNSFIFGKVRRMFGNVRMAFEQKLGQSSEIFGLEIVKNCSKGKILLERLGQA